MIKGKHIDLRPVSINDAEFILSLRLNPELNQYLSPVENNLKNQQDWIKKSINNPLEWYFVIQNKKAERVGAIRIYNIQENTFCWGSWIVIPEARSYASLESIVLLYQYAFFELGFERTHFDVRKKNQTAIAFYLRFGAKITHEDEHNYFLTYTKNDLVEKLSEYTTAINAQRGPFLSN